MSHTAPDGDLAGVMKRNTFSPVLCLIAALSIMPGSARASFHLYAIQEIFTNADGSVQFIELFTTFANQQFLGGHTITFQSGVNTLNTTPLAQLPGSSQNKSFLVGTANLGTLYGVTPDFVIPANFFAAGPDNFINFAEGTDRVNLSLLPANGTSSINGQIGNSTPTSISVNSFATPTNFAGQTATIPEPSVAALGLLATAAAVLRRRR